jgi:serine/threonine protein kinase
MARVQYQALGPVMAGEGSRAFLGLEISEEAEARPVVLIWVPDEVISDPHQLAILQKETLRATQLIHPNILRVYDLARVDTGVARVTEFADGETLRAVLAAGKKLAAPLAAMVATDAATGIYFAHEAGNDDGTPLVHGDVRPETVMVSFNGLCTVTGYGALSVAPRETGGKRALGRRSHSAPEQIVGGREAVRPQTDVYLLGLLLYECLTGTVPFEDDPDLDQAILTRPFPLLESEEIPPALRAVIARATAKKATERYPTAIAFREAVEEAQQLPPREEFASYLNELFPVGSEARAARRRVIDAGIADFARGQWAVRKASGSMPGPAPEAPAVPPPPPPPAPEPPPAAAPPPPPPSPSPPVAAPDQERDPRTRAAVAVLIAVIAAVVVIVIWTRRARPQAPPPPPPPPVAAIVDAGAPPLEVDAGADAGAAPDGGVALDGGADVPNVPSEATSLSLVVEPSVDVEIDGAPAGHAPLTVPLAPGRHRVVLTDKRKGINVVRSVLVGPKGVTREEIHLSRGYVTVSAPSGAMVTFDGHLYGKAPLKGEVTLYEGPHQILVTVGKARWQQSFSVRAGEHAYFNVETQ